MNEFLLILHIGIIALTALAALQVGKEALISFICLSCILANLFVTKQITLFGLSATCSDALAVGAGLGLNLLQEYYGKNSAKKAIWISFGFCLFYTLMSQLHLHYIPNAYDSTQVHYINLLSHMPRIIIASLLSYFICQQVDCQLFGYCRKKFSNSNFLVRNYLSIGASQLLDTILFSLLGLYGIVENIWHLILISYLIKCFVLITSSPFLWLTKKLIKSRELTYETV